MTHNDFNQLLSTIKALTPEQVRRIRQQLDSQLAQPMTSTAQPSGKGAKRIKRAGRQAKKPLSIEKIHRQMLASGLITRLPDPAQDLDDDDPDDQPVPIEGEPLSETIIRERH